MSEVTEQLLLLAVSLLLIGVYFWLAARIYKAAPATWKLLLYIIWPAAAFSLYLGIMTYCVIRELSP